jgi:hypothetical protein
MALLVGGFGWQFSVLNPLIGKNVLHVGAGGFGLFGTCAAIGGVLSGVYSMRPKNPGQYEFIAWSGCSALPSAPQPPWQPHGPTTPSWWSSVQRCSCSR